MDNNKTEYFIDTLVTAENDYKPGFFKNLVVTGAIFAATATIAKSEILAMLFATGFNVIRIIRTRHVINGQEIEE